jgi:hypothetical protein
MGKLLFEWTSKLCDMHENDDDAVQGRQNKQFLILAIYL